MDKEDDSWISSKNRLQDSFINNKNKNWTNCVWSDLELIKSRLMTLLHILLLS